MELPHLKKQPENVSPAEIKPGQVWGIDHLGEFFKVAASDANFVRWDDGNLNSVEYVLDHMTLQEPTMGPETDIQTRKPSSCVPRGFIEVTHRQKPVLVNVVDIQFVQPDGVFAMIVGDSERWRASESYEEVKRRIADAV